MTQLLNYLETIHQASVIMGKDLFFLRNGMPGNQLKGEICKFSFINWTLLLNKTDKQMEADLNQMPFNFHAVPQNFYAACVNITNDCVSAYPSNSKNFRLQSPPMPITTSSIWIGEFVDLLELQNYFGIIKSILKIKILKNSKNLSFVGAPFSFRVYQ